MLSVPKYGISVLFISPIKVRVLDRVLISIFYSSLEELTIETSNEIKSAIMNSFVHPWQERLSCFDCKMVKHFRIEFQWPWKERAQNFPSQNFKFQG